FETKADAVFGLQRVALEAMADSDDVLETVIGAVREYAGRVAEDRALYETQARLALDQPQVRVWRLQVILGYEDAIYEAFRRETPSADPIATRLAAKLAGQLVVAVMEDWIEAGTPRRGPAWERGIELMRREVESLLGR